MPEIKYETAAGRSSSPTFKSEHSFTGNDFGKKLVDLETLDGIEQANMALGAVIGLLIPGEDLEGIKRGDMYALLNLIHGELDENLRKTDN